MREHDSLYLYEDRYNNPTELTKWTWDLTLNCLNTDSQKKMASGDFNFLDVGCAAGESLFYFKEKGLRGNITGVDIGLELINKAQSRVPGVQFIQGSILDSNLIKKLTSHWDVIVMKGVHGIFEEPADSIINLLKIASAVNEKASFRVVVVGPFNPVPIDVFVKYKYADQHHDRQPGWNLTSMQTVENRIKNFAKNLDWKWFEWEPPIDIEPNIKDPVRTFTKRVDDGKKIITNGLQLILPIYGLVIGN